MVAIKVMKKSAMKDGGNEVMREVCCVAAENVLLCAGAGSADRKKKECGMRGVVMCTTVCVVRICACMRRVVRV